VRKEKNAIRIDVEDTGIGIPKEQAHRVFTKFFRGDNAQLFQMSGTGLGLYVSKNIAEKHGGTLSFESNEQKGSTFTVILPIATEVKKYPM
jgi:signal transduction histidine kinase